MKWLNSLDELLYEVMSWLLFFPLTLWRILRRPLSMMEYADQQLTLPDDARYADALSPPLFLALAVLIADGAASALGEADQLVAAQHGLATLITDTTSALILRVIVFAAFPLLAAARQIRGRGLPLDRATLQMPFYAQCYPTAVFALGLGIGASLASYSVPAAKMSGGILLLATLAFYATVETRWFAAKLGTGYARATVATMLVLLEGLAILIVVGYLFAR